MALGENKPVEKKPIVVDEETQKLVDSIDLSKLTQDEDVDEDETEDVETEESDELEEEPEVTDSDSDAEESDEAEEEETDTKGKRVPLVKYVEEKKKRQQLEAEALALKFQLQELQGDTVEREVAEYQQKIKERYIKKGYDEELATSLAEDMSELYKAAHKPATQGNTETLDKYSVAISKLKAESEYYDNAESFSDKIRETMKAAEKAGIAITAKQAYNMVVDPDIRQKELSQRKVSTGNKQSSAQKSPTSAGSKSTVSSALKSRTDREALAMIQREYPNLNFDVKKYAEWKKKQ